MSEFEIWFSRAIIVALIILVWGVFRWGVKKLVGKIEELIKNIQDLNSNFNRQQGEIKLMKWKINIHEKRLVDHTTRIRDMEKKQDSCPYCKQ